MRKSFTRDKIGSLELLVEKEGGSDNEQIPELKELSKHLKYICDY